MKYRENEMSPLHMTLTLKTKCHFQTTMGRDHIQKKKIETVYQRCCNVELMLKYKWNGLIIIMGVMFQMLISQCTVNLEDGKLIESYVTDEGAKWRTERIVDGTVMKAVSITMWLCEIVSWRVTIQTGHICDKILKWFCIVLHG